MIKMKINNRKKYEVVNDIVSKIADKHKVSPTNLILSYGVKPFLFNVYIGEQEIGQLIGGSLLILKNKRNLL